MSDYGTIMGSVALVQSAEAEAVARRAEDTACATFVDGFDVKTAPVSSQLRYASCVERLHPVSTAMSPAEILGVKIAITIVIVCSAIGAYWEGRGGYSSAGDYLAGAFIGFIISPFVMGFLYGIYFLITK